jgi:hypothetical protein
MTSVRKPKQDAVDLSTRISRDGQPPKPEIHTTRTECNNTSQSFVSAVLNADGRAKPKEMMVSKDAAKYQWWKNESAKTPVRKPIVANTSGKDAVDSSTLGPLPEVPSQPAPSPLTGADPSISSLYRYEINQERS